MSGDKHSAMRHGLVKAQDTLGGLVGRAKAKTAGSQSADAFVKNAAIGDQYEIRSSEIALRRSKSEQVRDLARRMIDDHVASTHQLLSALRMNETNGVSPPPADPDARREKMLDHLEKAPDGDFDTTYLDQQVMAHKETHDLMTGYADNGDNPQLRSLAQATAPVIARHLKHVERVAANV